MSQLGELGDQLHDPTAPMDVEPHSDLGNSHRLVAAHGHEIRYVPDWGCWLAWDGTRWARDSLDRITHMAAACARRWLLQQLDTPDTPARKHALRWALQSENLTRIRAAMTLAAAHPTVAVPSTTLDPDPWQLTTPTGTIDLRTGTTGPHDPTHLITRTTAGSPTTADDAPRFHRFLARVQPDPQMRDYLARVLGSCLVGEQLEHLLPILTGNGQNGKSTLVNAAVHALGDYAAHGARDLLTGGDPHTESVADLQGRRLVTLIETGQRRSLNEAFVKSATGGDPITARHLYAKPYTFPPSHTFVLATNHLPEVDGTDDGVWRRLVAVPFDVRIPDTEKDGALPAQLRTEADGILRWLVDGCLAWQATGLAPPATVLDATAAYRADEDHLSLFLDERCYIGPHVSTTSKELFGAYQDWCREQGITRPLRGQQVGRRLRDRGVHSRRGAKGRREWDGIEVVPDDA